MPTKFDQCLNSLNNIVSKISAYLCSILLSAMVTIVLLQVYFRYIQQDPLSWAEEVARYVMVWMAFLGSYIALINGQHVGIETLSEKVPPKFAVWIHLTVKLVILFFVVFAAITGWNLAMRARIQTAAYFEMSMFWAFLSVPAACTFMALDTLVKILNDINKALGRKGDDELQKIGS